MKTKYDDKQAWGTSLVRFPWNDRPSRTPSEALVEDTAIEWFQAKHRPVGTAEAELVNSVVPDSCPLCGSALIRTHGWTAVGIRRYRCLSCKRTFTPLTGTVFDSRKIPLSEWVEYLLHLFEYHSMMTSSRDNRNAQTTGRYWIRKVFAVLDGIQDGIVLSGDVWMDETYFPVEAGDAATRDGKLLRGISRNMMCIAVATDSSGRSVIVFEGMGKPTGTGITGALGGHIAPGSRLIHDGEGSHRTIVERLGLESVVYRTGPEQASDPLEPVNRIHFHLKEFMSSHPGFDRNDIQGWMNLAAFVLIPPLNRYEKVALFLEMALNCHKRMRYRDVI